MKRPTSVTGQTRSTSHESNYVGLRYANPTYGSTGLNGLHKGNIPSLAEREGLYYSNNSCTDTLQRVP